MATPYPQSLNTIGTTTVTTGVASASTSALNICYPPQEDKAEMPEYERQTNKVFSKTILEQKIEEYRAGKYTKRYIDTYLDFMHLEGIITNLQYLEFKDMLKD